MKIKSLIDNHKSKGLTFFDQAVLSGSSFLVTIILTRLLGLEQVGIYALLWILVLFAQSLHQAAIISPMLVFGSKQMENLTQKDYLNGLFLWHISLSALIAFSVSIFMFFYLRLYPETAMSGIQFKIPLLILLVLNNDFFRKWFYIKTKHHVVAIIDSIAYGIQLVLLLVLGLGQHLDLGLVFTIMIGTQLLASLICIVFAKIEWVSSLKLKHIFKLHADFSLWLLLASVFQWFTGNVLLLVGGKMLSMELIGALRIMQNLMGVLNVILLSFESYIPISAAKIFDHSGFSQLLKYLRNTVVKATGLFAVPLVLFALLAEPIITLVYGAEHSVYAYLLKSYVLLYVFIILAMILRIGLRAIEHTRPVFLSYVITALFSAVLAKPLIQQWADVGVIIGLIGAQIIMIVYYAYLIYYKSKTSKNRAQ